MSATIKKKYNHAFDKVKKGTKGYAAPETVKLRILARQNRLKIAPIHTAILKRYMNKPVSSSDGFLDIRLTHNHATSKKPLQSRMGKGKGRPESTSGAIFKGMPIANIHGKAKDQKIHAALSKISYRMGIRFKCKKVNKKTLNNVLKRTKRYQVKAAAERIKKIDECLRLIDQRRDFASKNTQKS